MSGKVKVTQEQAEAIESMKKEHLEALRDLYKHPEKYELSEDEEYLMTLTPEKFFSALYKGYEVEPEPEFEVGDWVKHKNGYISKITCVDKRVVVTTDHPLGYKNTDGNDAYLNSRKHLFRHATPEEIATEKQRRWWTKHNREVWELKEGDIFAGGGTIQEVLKTTKDETSIKATSGIFDRAYLERQAKVMYFAEDRKDIIQEESKQ